MTNLEKIELNIRAERDKVELADALIFLEKNKHFKKLFTETYLRDFALGMLTFTASLQAQEPKVQAHAQCQLTGVAGLQQFLANVRQTGVTAREALFSAEQELENILAEEG